MEIRIHRTYRWQNKFETIGGKPTWYLEATDTLQYYSEWQNDWVDVPVVEDEPPPHPDDVERQKMLDEMKEGMIEVFSVIRGGKK